MTANRTTLAALTITIFTLHAARAGEPSWKQHTINGKSEFEAAGVLDVDGVTWVVYQGDEQDGKPAEPVWTTRLDGPTGPSQIAITGAAGPDEFRTLAAATQAASPLPVA